MFGRVLAGLGEFWSVWDSFGAFDSVLERLEVFWGVWEGIGAFERVLERFGAFERFGEFCNVRESPGAFFGRIFLMSSTRHCGTVALQPISKIYLLTGEDHTC